MSSIECHKRKSQDFSLALAAARKPSSVWGHRGRGRSLVSIGVRSSRRTARHTRAPEIHSLTRCETYLCVFSISSQIGSRIDAVSVGEWPSCDHHTFIVIFSFPTTFHVFSMETHQHPIAN